MWHHWHVSLSGDIKITVLFQTQKTAEAFRQHFARWPGKAVRQNLRNGTILYEGVHADETPQFSAWRLAIYGGVHFASHDPADGICSTIGIITEDEQHKIQATAAEIN
jgi:hypothetical protein